jgi:hypothetical protein
VMRMDPKTGLATVVHRDVNTGGAVSRSKNGALFLVSRGWLGHRAAGATPGVVATTYNGEVSVPAASSARPPADSRGGVFVSITGAGVFTFNHRGSLEVGDGMRAPAAYPQRTRDALRHQRRSSRSGRRWARWRRRRASSANSAAGPPAVSRRSAGGGARRHRPRWTCSSRAEPLGSIGIPGLHGWRSAVPTRAPRHRLLGAGPQRKEPRHRDSASRTGDTGRGRSKRALGLRPWGL